MNVQHYTFIMSSLDRRRIDREFQLFSNRNFEKPKKCKNLEQIRFYVQELSHLISSFKKSSGYVPAVAYELLAQYNQEQNKWIYANFQYAYS